MLAAASREIYVSDSGPGNEPYQPQWQQPNPYGPPAPPPNYPPSYGPPAPPVYPPAPEPGGYPAPGYQQPGYAAPPTAPYSGGQYPAGQPYGPGYPAASYGAPPPVGPPGYSAPGGSAPKRRKGLLIASGVVVAAIIVIAVLALVVNHTSSKASSTPADAAKALLSAAKSGNKSAVLNALCAQDRSLIGTVGDNPFLGSDQVSSYQVGAVSQTDPTHATVKVTVSTNADPTSDSEDIPVEKDGGGWKACFTSAIFGGGSGSGLPTSLPSGLLPTGLPSGLLPTALPSGALSNLPSSINAICASQSSSIVVAVAYVGLAETGATTAAQSCVYKDSVPIATTQKLSGQTLLPSAFGTDSVTFNGSGSTVTVKVTKESDGNSYVTGVTIG
jgi:hypothetical protein